MSTHEIKPLSDRYGIKEWQSYLESKTPSAGRIFWVYGSDKNQITIIGIEPHPEDKKRAGYNKVKLSDLSDWSSFFVNVHLFNVPGSGLWATYS